MAGSVALAFDILAKDKASKTLGQVGDKAGKTGKQVAAAGRHGGKGFGLGIGSGVKVAAASLAGLGLARVFTGFIKDAAESAKIGRLTDAVIKSTGGSAKVSAKQVGDLATAISNKTGVDDEAIQSAENMLLTFTGVRNEVGKGNDIFNQATSTIVDMSAALGSDPKAAAIQLGKALNDPIKGVTALSKVGVSFTAKQKAQIKSLVEHGRVLDAQKIILKELGTEFGGAARAASSPMARLKVVLGNIGEEIGGVFLPYLEKGATFLTEKFIPAAKQVLGVLFKGDFKGGPFAEDSGFIDGVFKARDAFKNLFGYVKAEVLPRLKDVAGFIGTKVVPKLVTMAEFVGRNKEFFKPFVATIVVLIGALKVWTAVQTALNIVMTANPIGLVVVAIAALVAGLVVAYKHSETFRRVVDAAFKGVSKAASFMWNDVLKPVFKFIINAWLTVAGAIVNGAASAFGWVPGLGGKLKAAAQAFNTFRDIALAALDGIPKTVTVQTKLRLTLDKSGFSPQASASLARAGFASGGRPPVGVASWVGEEGKELFVPDQPGTILSHSESMSLVGSGRRANVSAGGGDVYHIDARGAAAGVGREIVAAIRKYKQETGGRELGIA